MTVLEPSAEWALGAFGASLFLFLAALAYPKGMGMGDVKLALLLGAMLGRTVPVALMIGMLAALVPSVVLLARHGSAARKMGIPFAPFLALGGIVALFFGDALLDAYLSSSRRSTPSRAVKGSRRRCRYLDRGIWPATATEAAQARQRRRTRHAPTRRRSARGMGVNAMAELVVDLISATGLVAPTSSRSCAAAPARARSPRRSSTRASRRPRASPARSPSATSCRSSTSRSTGVDKDAAEQIPLHVLERVVAIPYALDGDTLRVAVADPGNVHAIDELRLATRYPLELGVASSDDILVELRRLARASEAFGARAVLEEVDEELRIAEEEEADDLEVDDGISDAPLVRLVNSVIFQAAEDGASDIHFEPQEDALVVRFRIDGVLHEVQRIPKRMTPGVTTRLKVLAKLDIAERRKPQDGRISLNAAAAGRMLDIRVATLPTVEGEKVVMRLLDKSRRAPTLEELGLSDEMRARLADDHRAADRRAARHRPDRLR